MDRPTLILQTVCFQDSDRPKASRLGADLYHHLTRPLEDPLAFGPGILVFRAVEPEFVDLEAAEYVIVLPVLGKQTHMDESARKRALETIQTWSDQGRPKQVLIVPVPTTEKWRAEEDRLPGKNLLTEIYGGQDRRDRTLDEIVLATLRLIEPDRSKGSLFVSHAKADLASTGDAAKKIHDYVVSDTTGNSFFDVTDLGAGHSIGKQINDALEGGVFVSVRTDSYSSRDWCQRELLVAKQNRLPTLTVEILRKGESLSSPYGGNGPTMMWADSPEEVVSRALVECLRAAYFRKESKRTIESAGLPEDSVAMNRPPELLDLVQGPIRRQGAQVVIHPDPELSASLRELLAAANPRLKLVTPTTAFRRIGQRGNSVTNPFDRLQVALSLSDSPSVDGPEGYAKEHVEDATVFLARSLIAAGAHIAYGGDFRRGGYTEILSELISAYRQAAGEDQILHSYLGAPIDLEDVPDDFLITAHHMGMDPFKQESKLPVWNHGNPDVGLIPFYVSEMRLCMAKQTQARVVLGGASVPRLAEHPGQGGYGGRYPGVVEEAWRTLEAGQPLYVVGGYGGAAALIADLVEGKATPEDLQDDKWLAFDSFKARCDLLDNSPYREALGLPESMEAMAERIRTLGADLLRDDETCLAKNGLTVEQNRRLLRSRDPVMIASLVFEGLQRIYRRSLEGKLEIELVEGSITAATDIDSLAVGAFDDLPLGGAGGAIDQLVAGRATLAREGGRRLISLDSDELAADWMYLASLGSFKELKDVSAAVERAGQETAEQALRHGFSRLGMVAYGGTMIDEPQKAVAGLLRGLAPLAGQTTIVWFENDPSRFKGLHELLKADVRVKVTTRQLRETAKVVRTPAPEQVVVSVTLENDVLTSRAMFPGGTGVASVIPTTLTRQELRRFSKGDPGSVTPNEGSLQTLGVELAGLLFGDSAGDLLERCEKAKISIIHDVPSSQLPFEILRGVKDEKVLLPAVQGGINRRLAVQGLRFDQLVARPPHTGKLRVLLVINPLGDLESAEKEGQVVAEALGQQADRIEVHVIKNKAATRDAVLEGIAKADVLHYCGHAFYDGPGEEESGLNLYGEPLMLADLKDKEFSVRLAFVNACESGRVRATKPEARPEAPPSASFAEYFLRMGIEAYLGTYWKVGDEAAAKLAASVYSSLARGDTLDKAVREGRQKLQAGGSGEWANYILYGEGQFQLVKPV